MSEPSVAPTAAVDHLKPRTDLAPVIKSKLVEEESDMKRNEFEAKVKVGRRGIGHEKKRV